MDFASFILRSLTVAAALAGVAAVVTSFFDLSIKTLTPNQVRGWSLAFIFAALVLGALDYWIAASEKREADSHGPTITVDGSTTGDVSIQDNRTSIEALVINEGGNSIVDNSINIESVVINEGDSAEVRERKKRQAATVVAEEIVQELLALQTRLDFIEAASKTDDFEDALTNARSRLAPGTAPSNSDGYRQLIDQERVTSLRHALNSRPLSDGIPGPLIATVVDSEAHSASIQQFSSNLVEVAHVTESLLTTMQDFSRRAPLSQEESAYREEKLRFHTALIRNRSHIAHLSGLHALEGVDQESTNSSVAKLAQASGTDLNSPLGQLAYANALRPLTEEAEKLLVWREQLLERSTALRDQALAEYEQLDEELRIDNSDGWAIVVGKARALRVLGRVGDAVAAFARYGDMFAATDGGAEVYASIAQQFTTQLQRLNLLGGVYVFEILSEGPAANAGLQVGDIIVSYAGITTPGVAELTQALHDAPLGQVAKVEYLRLGQDGAFKRKSASFPAGSLGAGLMPI